MYCYYLYSAGNVSVFFSGIIMASVRICTVRLAICAISYTAVLRTRKLLGFKTTREVLRIFVENVGMSRIGS